MFFRKMGKSRAMMKKYKRCSDHHLGPDNNALFRLAEQTAPQCWGIPARGPGRHGNREMAGLH